MKRLFFSLIMIAVFFQACKDDEDGTRPVNLTSYTIPGETFFPEGIAYDDDKGVFYVTSIGNGDILKVDVETGTSNIFASGASQGRGTCNGIKLDSKGRLWVCGGTENKIHVLNADGSLLKSWDLSPFSSTGFINDCIIDNNYVYFTDSRNQHIYRTNVSIDQPSEIEKWLTFTNNQIPYTENGVNSNGIVITPDSKYLIMVVSSSGKLYRIETGNKAINEIQLNTPVNAGDGLWLENNTLYISRNAVNQIFPITLNNEYSQGTVGSGFGENLLFNTTMAKAGQYFLVVNGQLNRRSGPTPPILPFTVSRVEIPKD